MRSNIDSRFSIRNLRVGSSWFGARFRGTRLLLSVRLSVFLSLALWVTPAVEYHNTQADNLGVVYATLETTPVLSPPDAADDIAIWIHPTDPSLSTIIGTDKPGGLEIYDLSGAVLQRIPFKCNNVDLRYNFPLGGENVTLVTGINRTTFRLFAYKVNPQTRLLENVAAPSSVGMSGLQGSAMYLSPVTGKYYAFMNFNGVLRQYELFDDNAGRVALTLVRTVTFSSAAGLTEGVVADDVHGKVYVSEEGVGIWKLDAEPSGGEAKVMVDTSIVQGGHLQPDVEGLTIYYKNDGTGYLMASSQGNATFVVYQRTDNNEYVGTFNIADGVIDKVTGTDGIDVTNFPLGPAFPSGVFIAQDGVNKDGDVVLNQNFKLVPFESIAEVLNLNMDTSWDPRLVGAGPGPNPTSTALPTETSPASTGTPTPVGTPVETETATPSVTFTATPAATFTPTLTRTPTSVPTLTSTAAPTNNPLYLSLAGKGTVGGITAADEDILRFDGTGWSLFFDGSDVGVGSPDLFGFTIVDSNTILMAFSNAVTVNGLAIVPQDVVRFQATSLGSNTAGTFSMYLDGSDVGLDSTAEKIDSISLLPDGRVLISTTGNPSVPGVSGRDEDVLAFTPTSLGEDTAGTWAMYFDGSEVGLADTSGEDVDALDVVNGKIYLSTLDAFTVPGVSGADEDVFVCEATSLGDVTACIYSASLYFDGSLWGLSANDVDAINLQGP